MVIFGSGAPPGAAAPAIIFGSGAPSSAASSESAAAVSPSKKAAAPRLLGSQYLFAPSSSSTPATAAVVTPTPDASIESTSTEEQRPKTSVDEEDDDDDDAPRRSSRKRTPSSRTTSSAAAKESKSYAAAPLMTDKELKKLTTRNTATNAARHNEHVVQVINMDENRPPSPTAKIRRSSGAVELEGTAGRPTTKAGRDARAARRGEHKRALRMSMDGQESSMTEHELAAEADEDAHLDEDARRRKRAARGSLVPHFHAAGDEPDGFQSPVRVLAKKPTSRKRSSTSHRHRKSSSSVAQQRRGVKWDRILIYEGALPDAMLDDDDVVERPLLVRTRDLDEFGNLRTTSGAKGTKAQQLVLAREQVVIQRVIYRDDDA